MPKPVRKAIVPTAGLGTRLYPVTRTVPKELLPIGSVPMLHRAIAELVRGDVREIAIIVTSRKTAIQDYVSTLDLDCTVYFVEQPEPRGVADAILRAGEFLADDPFVFFMPDEVCFCPTSPVTALKQVYATYDKSVLGLTWVPPQWLEFFQGTGRIVTAPLKNDCYRILQLKDKSRDRLSTSPTGQQKGVGIGILDGEFLALARQQQQMFDGQGEFDDVPIWQELVRRKRLLGVMADGAIVDAGNPLGFGLANRYWLETGRQFSDKYC
ncbi:MAG: sugar phosphate nucleotidyltransferase [Cyanobacteria bacterium P01_E01_bin.34]